MKKITDKIIHVTALRLKSNIYIVQLYIFFIIIIIY
jgi:hypothetical protein